MTSSSNLENIHEKEDSTVEQLIKLTLAYLKPICTQETFESLLNDVENASDQPKSLHWSGKLQNTSFSDIMSKTDISSDYLLNALKRVLKETKVDSLEYLPTVGGGEKLLSDRTLRYQIYGIDLSRKEYMDRNHSLYTNFVQGHNLPIFCVCFDETNRRVLTGSDDGNIKVWCLRTGLLMYCLRGHSSCITDFNISPDNTLLISGSIDNTLRLWDLQRGRPIKVISCPSQIVTVEFQPKYDDTGSTLILSTCLNGFAYLWRLNLKTHEHEEIRKFSCKQTRQAQIRNACFSEGGTRFIVCGTDGIVRIFSVNNLDYVLAFDDHVGAIPSIHCSSTEFKFATGSRDGSSRIWKFHNGWKSTKLDHSSQDYVPSVSVNCFNIDSNFLLSACSNYKIYIWDAMNYNLMHTIEYHTNDIFIVKGHPQNPRIMITVGLDLKLALWDIYEGKLLNAITLNSQPLDVDISRDGSYIAVADSSGVLTLYGSGVDVNMYKDAPNEQFFAYDSTTLVYDQYLNAIDEISQSFPHNLPRVTFDSNSVRNHIDDENYGCDMPIKLDLSEIEYENNRISRLIADENCIMTEELLNHAPFVSTRKRNYEDDDMFPSQPVEYIEPEPLTLMDVLNNVSDGSEYEAESSDEQDDYDVISDQDSDVSNRSRLSVDVDRRRSNRIPVRRRLGSDDSGEQIVQRRRPKPNKPDHWVSLDKPSKVPYVPQIGDAVIYFKEGHKLFLQSETDDTFNTKPYENFDIPDIFRCKISNVTFHTHTISVWASVELTDGQITFPVSFYDTQNMADFIILEEHFQWTEDQNWKIGDSVQVVYEDDKYFNGVIQAVKTGTTWNTHTVFFENEEFTDDFCVWELDHPETQFLSQQKYLDAERVATELEKLSLSNRYQKDFYYPVDYARYKTYLKIIAYPMYLELMIKRLRNSYYRRKEAFEWDLDLLRSNVELYNEAGSRITTLGHSLCNRIESVVQGGIIELDGDETVYSDEDSAIQETDFESDSSQSSDSGRPLRRTRMRAVALQGLRRSTRTRTSSRARKTRKPIQRHFIENEIEESLPTPRLKRQSISPRIRRGRSSGLASIPISRRQSTRLAGSIEEDDVFTSRPRRRESLRKNYKEPKLDEFEPNSPESEAVEELSSEENFIISEDESEAEQIIQPQKKMKEYIFSSEIDLDNILPRTRRTSSTKNEKPRRSARKSFPAVVIDEFPRYTPQSKRSRQANTLPRSARLRMRVQESSDEEFAITPSRNSLTSSPVHFTRSRK